MEIVYILPPPLHLVTRATIACECHNESVQWNVLYHIGVTAIIIVK